VGNKKTAFAVVVFPRGFVPRGKKFLSEGTKWCFFLQVRTILPWSRHVSVVSVFVPNYVHVLALAHMLMHYTHFDEIGTAKEATDCTEEPGKHWLIFCPVLVLGS
jgi:hypothetical protein